MNRLSPIVKQLLIINIIFYFGTQNLLSIKYAMSLNFPEYSSFAVWQIFTHMFMHGNIQHLLFNMFALWMFGSSVEYMLGSKKFLFFYISSGF